MIKRIMILLAMLFLASNAYATSTYLLDFEDGVDGEGVSGDAIVWSNLTYSTVNVGGNRDTMCARADFKQNVATGNTCGTEFYSSANNLTMSESSDVWMHVDMYFTTGADFSGYDDPEIAVDIKIFRLTKRKLSDDSLYGFNSIMILGEADGTGHAYASLENSAGAPFRSGDTFDVFELDTWYEIDLHFVENTDGSSDVTMKVNGVTKIEENYATTDEAIGRQYAQYLFPNWNEDPAEDQTWYVDNFYLSNEQSYDDYRGLSTSSNVKATNITASNITFS